jgi:membrane associated rhomboid family serine protease
MFVPIYDYNPLRYYKTAWMTRALIALNVAIFLFFQSGFFLADGMRLAAVTFGITPDYIAKDIPILKNYSFIPPEITFITYMFLHGGWLHLIGNMLFLWVFGDNVEDAMGRRRFLAFYILCGVAGGLAHYLSQPASKLPLVGASGAVAGIIAAYLMLHPHVKVWVLALGRIPIKLRAMWLLGFWVLLQIGSVLLNFESQISWWAHVGGLAAGAALITVFRRPGVPLFDRDLPAPGAR